MNKTILKLTNNPPGEVRWNKKPAPTGAIMIGVTKNNEICRVHFIKNQTPAAVLKKWQREWPRTQFVKDKKVKLPRTKIIVSLSGTPFQKSVWKALMTIPAGRVVSYGDIAKKIKKPKAVRAVGNALGTNPVPIFMPCHRVIAGDGTLGGYGGGLDIKKRLLKAEKITISNR